MSEVLAFDEGLFDQLVEQLRMPLSKIRLLSEVGDQAAIGAVVSQSIQLLDDLQYLRDLNRKQLAFEIETINLSALTNDVAHRLGPTAASRKIEMRSFVSGSRLVLAHRKTLERAYENMARAVIDMADPGGQVLLSASPDRGTVLFGAYSPGLHIAASDYNRLKRLGGKSTRPLGTHIATPVLELTLARWLFDAVGSNMRTAISAKNRGFAGALEPTSQLSFVV